MHLYPHQQEAVDKTPDKWCLWWKMRVGKSPTAIRLACTRAKSAIIIAPKSVVSHWKREVETWKVGECDFIVTSPEQFKKHVKELPACEALIIDEIHSRYGNYKNQAYKALMFYVEQHNPRFIWGLSGTPMTASHWCVYSYGLLLGKKWQWVKWNRFFNYQTYMGPRKIWMPRKDRDKDLQKILKSIGTTLRLSDITTVMEDQEVVETFSLNAEQKKLIKPLITELPIVRFTAEHQLEQGVWKSDGYREEVLIECEKDKRLVELVRGIDKVIIVCRYHAQINKYAHLLSSLNKRIFIISGQSKQTASEIAPLAEADDNCIVIAQGDSCVGYSLKSFNVMIFASMSFSFVNYTQMKSRMKAVGKIEPCQYIYLITEGKSVDQGVYDAVMKKQDFSIELFRK